METLIVVVLFGLLAALAYRSAWRSAEKTRMRTAWGMLRLIDAAQWAYSRDNPAGFATAIGDLVNGGYIDDPMVGQNEWEYAIVSAAEYEEAKRLTGPCANKRLRRYYHGPNMGNETETLTSCP